MNIFTN